MTAKKFSTPNLDKAQVWGRQSVAQYGVARRFVETDEMAEAVQADIALAVEAATPPHWALQDYDADCPRCRESDAVKVFPGKQSVRCYRCGIDFVYESLTVAPKDAPAPVEKRCGTCAHGVPVGDAEERFHDCNAPMPAAVHYFKAIPDALGADCPCWKAKP